MRIWLGLCLFGVVGLWGCQDGGDASPAAARYSFAANAVTGGDPRAVGQAIYFASTFGTERLDTWPPASFMLELMVREPEVFGNQFARFGFLPDPNDDLPIGLKRGDENPEKVHETCALCHVARLPDGRIWIGAPNNRLDIGAFKVAVNERWVAAGNPPLMDDLAVRSLWMSSIATLRGVGFCGLVTMSTWSLVRSVTRP